MTRASDTHQRKTLKIADSNMSYVDVGEGPPICLLHGNPTWSYIWRNVIPHLSESGRCIAPDLIGMGASGKLPNSGADRYSYKEHRDYLFGFFDTLEITEPVVLILHDWGAALGLNWAREHPELVRGIALMEPLLMPLTWDTFPAAGVEAFKAMRSPQGEQMCLEENFFVEQVIPMAVMRELDAEEIAAYRQPYAEKGEGRRPTLTWPREIPIDGTPAEMVTVLEANCDWLKESDLPKLFIQAEPGMMVTGKTAELCRSFPNVREVTVPGAHYVQEDSPAEIGQAIAGWIREIP